MATAAIHGHASPPTPFVAVMFDLDGTLVDTMGGFADLAAAVMVAHHDAAHDVARRRYLETSGIPFSEQLEVIYPAHRRTRDASDEFEARKLAVAESTTMDPDTVRGLHALRALGFKLIVSSNTGQPLDPYWPAPATPHLARSRGSRPPARRAARARHREC